MPTPDATARAPLDEAAAAAAHPEPSPTPPAAATAPREIGGRIGPEPTRFGDWERSGRCIDF